MKSLKGTQTEKNLLTSFAGESQARNRYTFFASQAKKDGYVLVQAVFEEIANQEKEHAKKMFKWLEGSTLEITASFPAGVIGDTAANLRAARKTKSCAGSADASKPRGSPSFGSRRATARWWRIDRAMAYCPAPYGWTPSGMSVSRGPISSFAVSKSSATGT